MVKVPKITFKLLHYLILQTPSGINNNDNSKPQLFRSKIPNPPTAPNPNYPSPPAFFNRLSSSIRQALSHRHPWSELLDRSSLSRPDTLSKATSRVRENFSYFRVNYIALISFVLAVSLLSHPFSPIVLLSLLASWSSLYLFRSSHQPLVIFGRNFPDREALGILVISTIVVVFLTSVRSLLISALLVGLAIVCAHGAFRVPEDLFFDDQEPANAGFLSFLGVAASSTAAAAAPVVVS